MFAGLDRDVEAVADHASDYGALIRFASATGLRPEEWSALTWGDVDIADRSVSVNKVWSERELRTTHGKTDAAFRIVSLQEPALAALRSLARPLDSTHLIFPAPAAATSTLITGAGGCGRKRSPHPGSSTDALPNAAHVRDARPCGRR